ncbi:UvrD-helicase domain-containing protein [Actinomadura chokoriensis]|uniref:DNA 3'-5' helicase n=1 Tax=Actinomadura chokoriensis TaxID=454156 RepID=A0ABV4QTJ7_9ACTN
MTPHDTPLTAEQLEIVEQPWDARLLVTAAAGTGKTYCLIERVTALIDDHELDAADILVLSFSRAAVREIKDRLAVRGGNARDVDVRTFDSYATWLLSEVDPDGAWQGTGYEGRIRTAVRLMGEDEHAAELVAEIQHVVVDEVQDLVEARADLVKMLLEKAEGGFTLLGDPAQGIYSFQVEDRDERMRGAAGLYDWIRSTYGDELTEATLTENFRAREPETRVALPFGPLLGKVDADYASVQRDLRTELLAGPGYLGTLKDAIPVLLDMTTPTAILCRNNGEALAISRELHNRGVPHRLQRSAQDRVVPPWVASLFLTFDWPRPSRQDVMRQLETTTHGAGFAPDLVWKLLKRMDGNPANQASLDLSEIKKRLSQGTVPDELTRQTPAQLVVSTIHRVKGLEFDQVAIVDPGDPKDDAVEQAEAARLLYVAMTRPRDRLMWTKPVGSLIKGRLVKLLHERWAECGYGRHKYSRFGMEISGDDVHALDPAGTIGYLSDPRRVQTYLATKVPEGAEVTLTKLDEAESVPRYDIRHEGVHLGITSESFGRALLQTLRATPKWEIRRVPLAIHDVWIDGIETVSGSEASSKNSKLGEFGVWLRPRLTGLSRFVWKEK